MIKVTIPEFLGWYVGDGCISVGRYYEFTLTGDIIEEFEFYKKTVIPSFNKLFFNELCKPVTLKEYKSNSVCGIYLFDKKFVNLIIKKFKLNPGKKINISVPFIIKTKKDKIEFIRGLFDTDGSIYFGKSYFKPKKISFCYKYHYKPKIKISLISKKIIETVHIFLEELNIKSKLQKPYQNKINENIIYSLVLDTDEAIFRYLNKIGFRNPKHLTKIQVWKRYGFCPPYTTIKQRNDIIIGKISPFYYYQSKKIFK
jgi:hypothetical protein